MPTHADVVGVAGPARSLGGDGLRRRWSAPGSPASRGPATRGAALQGLLDVRHPPRPSAASAAASSCCTSSSPGTDRSPSHPPNREFGRYTAFSNHFGVFAGQVHRLDRHPVMSPHPSTPMHEADLRQVLAEQLTDRCRSRPRCTSRPTPTGPSTERWERLPGGARCRVRRRRGRRRPPRRRSPAPCAATAGRRGPADRRVGSGGIMAALARTADRPTRPPPRPPAVLRSGAGRVSASASSTTAAQIDDAVDARLGRRPDTGRAARGRRTGPGRRLEQQVVHGTRSAPAATSSSHTTRGPEDPRYAAAAGDPRRRRRR